MAVFARLQLLAASAVLALGLGLGSAQAQAPRGGLTQAQIDDLASKHDGYYGVLAPENLHKPRPKAPFDLTGTWFVDLRRSFGDFMFGPPYPQFYEPGQQAMKDAAAAAKAGKPYRDSIGECYPPGMPMIMTRVWPIQMIQTPTSVFMIAGFENSVRIIYMDGRKPSNPDIAVPSYNGESLGHWEGKTLVVHTRYLEPNQHYIDMGLPISDQFEFTERMQLLDKGETLQIEYVMTDPKNWKGEWRNTKRFLRLHNSDIAEVECLPNLNQHLPSTEEGQAAIAAREKGAEKP
ncbi:MAG TPA: hypothetical protein VIJ94_02765 [Caulobacteraceae bacterium]